MNEIPSWWLAVSGLFFVLNAVLFVFLIVAAIQFMKFMKDVAPRIEALEKSTQELIVNVQGVAKRVDEVAASVKETVDSVGGKARGLASSAELVVSATSRQFERITPVVTGVLTAIKVIRAVRDLRHARQEKKAEAEAKTKGRKKSEIAVYKR